jgi:deoxyribonuclease V
MALQDQLRGRVIRDDRIGTVRRVAGVDVGFEEGGKVTRAAVAVLSFPGLALEDSALAREVTRFPYVPGLLSFREAPAALEAFARLRLAPDLLLYDGHGFAHPRRFGIASHVGLLLDLPAIGVAKTRLIGEHGRVPAAKGGWTPLTNGGEVIGAVLRTRGRQAAVRLHRTPDQPGDGSALRDGVRHPLPIARNHPLGAPPRLGAIASHGTMMH